MMTGSLSWDTIERATREQFFPELDLHACAFDYILSISAIAPMQVQDSIRKNEMELRKDAPKNARLFFRHHLACVYAYA